MRLLRNKLGIKDEKTPNLVEAKMTRANMMLRYEQDFKYFSPVGFCAIHRFLFGDVYDWAGEYRKINIKKLERLLGEQSSWHSNDDDVPCDLELTFAQLRARPWITSKRTLYCRAA